MADFSDLWNAAISNTLKPAAPAAPVAPAPTPMDATSERIKMQLEASAPTKQTSVLEKMGNLTGDLSYYGMAVANARQSDAGMASASPIEKDLRTLSPELFRVKYGQDGALMADKYVNAKHEVDAENINDRGWGQAISDSTKSGVSGFGTTLGTIANWGVGAVDPRAGAIMAKQISDFNRGIQEGKSQNAQDKATQKDAMNTLTARDNQADYEKDLAAGPGKIESALGALDTALGYKPLEHSTVSLLRREGKNFLDQVGSEMSDPTTFAEGSANAIGSMLATGPMSKVIGLGGKALSSLAPQSAKLAIQASAAIDQAAGRMSASRLINAAAEEAAKRVPGSLAIGAMEGGGAYQQTAGDVMNIDLDTLAKQSPAFQKMVAGGMSPEDARATLAGQAGSQAAPRQALAGVLTGALVAPFEAHPFQIGGVRTALQNVGKEALEEGTQNASGQFFQNQAEKDTGVDPAKDLFDSIGQQAAQGALYGAAAAGHTAAPGVLVGNTARAAMGAAGLAARGSASAIDSVKDSLTKAGQFAKDVAPELTPNMPSMPNVSAPSVGGVGDAVKSAAAAAKSGLSAIKPYVSRVADYFANKGDTVMKGNEKNSPVSDEVMAQAADEVHQQSAQSEALKQSVDATPNITPEQKSAANDYLEQASKVTQLNPDEVKQWHPAAQAAVGDATTRFDALQRLQAFVSDTRNSDQDRLAVAAQLEDQKADINRFADENPQQLSGLPADHEARSYAVNVAAFAKGIDQTPSMRRADRAGAQLINDAQKILKPVTDENINTPEGQATAKTLASLAQIAPAQLDLNSLGVVLKHATKLGLSDQQKRSIRLAADMLNTAKVHSEERQANGDKPLSPQDLVAKEVTTEDTNHPFKKSALGHAQTIGAAYRAGNFDAARSQLLDLQKFAQSQSNKLAAINTHLVSGNADRSKAVHYDTLSGNADRSFSRSKQGVWISPTNEGTISFARRVASEAKFLTDLSNHLATAFPELNVKHLDHTLLDPRLSEGTVKEVVQGFADGIRSVKSGTPSTENQEAKQNVTESKPASVVPETKDAVKETAKPVEPVNATETVKEAPVASTEKVQKSEAPVVEKAKTTEPAKAEPVNEKPAATTSEPVKEEPKQGLAAAYPSLVQPADGGNSFTRAFRPAKPDSAGTPSSNISAYEAPVRGVADVVKQAIRGLPAKASGDVYKGYEAVFQDVNRILKAARFNLDKFLTEGQVGERFRNPQMKLNKKTGVTELDKASYAHRWMDGKVLNLTEDRDGTFKYNEQLLQGAALATASWYLSSGQSGGVFDEQDAAKALGIPVLAVDDDLMNLLKGSLSTIEVLDSLASKIQQYWGVRANDDMPIGLTEGIPLSMAAEMLRSMETAGMLKSQTIWVDTSEYGGVIEHPTEEMIKANTVKKIERITIEKLGEGDAAEALRKYPDLIEKAVLNEPTPTYYFDDQRPNVAREQMRNEYVKNTTDQLSALKNEVDTPHYLNPTMANLYFDMGRETALRWFGAGDLSDRVLNVNHEASLRGQNLTTGQAYDEFQNLHAALEGQAAETGADITDVPVHYGYNMSRVGRMQMLGKYNPQSTKFIREVLLPGRATLDLTDAKGMQAFELGLGQALGVKVHNLFYEDVTKKLNGLLDGDLKSVVEHFQSWLKSEADFDSGVIDNAFHAAKMDISPLALHALTEYARFMNATDKERQAFTTTKYLEADGMTNGPVNAMALLSTGPFTADWVSNMRRGGLEIGGTKENTSQQIRNTKEGAADLYQTATTKLRDKLSDLQSYLTNRGQKDVHQQMKHVIGLMDLFLPDLKMTDDGIEIGRGVAKNPLTITIYGSGATGIAGKLVRTMTTEIYARMSTAAQLMADAERAKREISMADAMFPNDPQADVKWDRYKQHIAGLTERVAVWSKKKEAYFAFDAPTPANKTAGSFTDYTFSPQELKNMITNVRFMFVDPLRQAISETVGPELEPNTTMIRQATQAQSILMQQAFVQKVEAALEEKAKTDPTFKRDEFLSAKEMKEVFKSMEAYHPLVQTDDQSFFIAGSQNSEVNTATFGRALNGEFRYPGYVYGPANAGVAGIPFLNIGMGDGKMMQILANDPRVRRTLKIFDGMNMPLDSITEQSQAANEAVLKSWQGNPIQAVYDAFSPFLAQIEKDGIDSLPKDVHQDLVRSLFGLDKNGEDYSTTEVLAQMHSLAQSLKESALEVQARHNVLEQVNLSVDQMSSAGAPHVVAGKIQINGTDEEKALILSKMYADELDRLKKEEGIKEAEQQVEPEKENAAAAKSEDIAGQINSFGRINKDSRARVLSPTAIKKLVMGLTTIPEHQKAILAEVRRSLAAKGYEVITGTRDQLAAHALLKGDTNGTFSSNVQGFTLPGSKRIYLMNPSSEILTHELIHAATFETILAHYNGEALSAETAQAIQAIEALRQQFVNLDVSKESPQTQRAWSDALNAIQNQPNDVVGRASSLNEFMAWALANKDLVEVGKKTNAVVQLAKDVFKAIKQLVYGRKKVPTPTPGSDLFSNLLFHTSVVMRSQPTVMERIQPTALYASTSYGNDERLADTNRAFNRMLENFKNQPSDPKAPTTPKAQANFAAVQAAGMAVRVQGQGFPMTMQEATTFSLIVAALGTQMHIDANSMSKAQDLYQHVTQKLSVEDFMKDPEADTDPNDRYQAQRKYNTILGQFGTTLDKQGRSSLLPVFLGLAMTNDTFRSVLAKMDMPASEKSKAMSRVDAYAENMGQGLMDQLGDRASGLKNQTDVQSALDALMQHVVQVADEREMFMNQNAAGNFLDTTNQAIVDGVERLTDNVIDRMQGILDDPKSSNWAKQAAKYAQLSARMATEKGGNIVAESVVSHMNRINAWQPLHDMVYDFVGRTEQNAPVYDMMKVVRSQVSQDRQNYREHVPSIIAGKFSRELEDHEWAALHRGITKTDLASLRSTLSHAEIQELLGDAKQLDTAVNALEDKLQSMDPKNWSVRQKKMQQLARFMMNGEVGHNLLRNATALSHLFGENKKSGTAVTEEMTQAIDQLTSLYAVEQLSPTERSTLLSLAQSEAQGISFATDYLVGQRAEEERKMAQSSRARNNGFKGYVPETTKDGVHLMVAEDSRFQELSEKSYERVADYQGSSADGAKKKMGYYFSGTSAKNVFLQGIFQNVRQTAGGVDIMTGYNNSTMTAGRITDRGEVAHTLLNWQAWEKGHEPLMPIYDAKGQVVAFERSIDPAQLERVQTAQNMAKRIGAWRGRQVEEAMAQQFNNALIDALHDRYETDMKKSDSKHLEYVNLFSAGYLKSDPVIADAVKLWTPETRQRIKQVFGEDAFWVPQDMLHDVTGYRQASVGDVFTGNSRLSPATQEYLKRTMIGMFGNKAYQYFTNGEKMLQNFIGDAKTLIVVKSVVVPMVNAMGNMLQLMSRGVSIKHIAAGAPKKIAETNFYVKQRQKQIDIEADIRAATDDPFETGRLATQWNSIEDSLKRLSIYPLIQNGEFTAISDATQVGADDVDLTSGKWHSFMESQVAKLPKSMQTAGRYALVTKDTALFKGLQKSVEYGDFIAKAVYYDDLIGRKKMSQEQALGRVTEEFVNYDKLPGRFRGYLESVGLLWFYNFKIRATKTAMNMVRNNPLHTLLAQALPIPNVFGSVGTPINDNFIMKLLSGQIGYSFGLGQILHAPQMNPWVNIFN